MKKLTKIQLINWHLFTTQNIKIKENVLISGENGAGKSTLLDALQYILIGEKNNVKFNIAANENAKRSLESYIKGKIGIENKEFLRNKDVISNISLEFYDSVKDEYTIFGCVLELPFKGALKDSFYLFTGLNLTSEIFTTDNKPKNSKEIRSYFRSLKSDFDFFTTKKQYHKAVGEYLGINIVKYLKILPKALSFKPLNLQKFIFDFLLDEQPINIIGLKKNVQQLKKIESQIELEQKKIKELKKIVEIDEKIKSLDNRIKTLFLSEKIVYVKQNEKNLEKIEKKQQNKQIELQNLSKEQKKLKEEIENLNNYILELQTNKNKDDLGFYLHSLQKDLKKCEKILQEYQNKINFFQKQLLEEKTILLNLLHLQKNPFLEKKILEINSFLESKNNKKNPLLKENLQELSQYLSKQNIDLNIKQNNLRIEIENLQIQINKNNSELQTINQNAISFNNHFFKICSLLKEQLYNKYNKNIFVHPLCHLIEIKDELWRNAIEGFLGTRKFNLIIEHKYFNDALKIFDKLQDDLRIYDVGLVNVEKIPDILNNSDSLASYISSNNSDAFKYAKILLSHIKCEHNIENLKKHKTAITPQCMIYSNYTAKKINPQIYRIPYIGMNSSKIRQEIIQQEINIQKNEFITKKELLNKNDNLFSLMTKSKINVLINSDYFEWISKKEEIEVNISDIKTKISDLKINNKLVQLEENIHKLNEEKKIKNKNLDDILLLIAKNKNEDAIYINQIEHIKKELILYKEELSQEENKEIIHIEAANIQYQNYINEYSSHYDIILKNIKEDIKKIEQQKNIFKIELISFMKIYINNYHLFNIEPKFENLNFFLEEYNLINSKNLIQYEQEAKELREKTEIIFKEEFINKLKESIIKAQEQIQILNNILKNRPFGNDYYEIITKASEDPEYKKYYSFFIEKNKQEQTDEFYQQIDSYKEIIINELFNKIISFEEEYENIYYAFLDYRNYLSYDIKIYNKNGDYSLFSKIFREKSGGETQVPFYIIIAICFEQLLLDNNQNKGCLILFDEAFNNMDEIRIEAMMSFFDSLKIQFIISVPPQRIINVIPYTKTNLIVMKENNYAIVEDFIKNI